MRKIMILITCLTIIMSCCLYVYNNEKTQKITAYSADYFVIPDTTKHLALLGCTPHPTQYVHEHDNKMQLLQDITLKDFLDIKYLQDSFNRTLLLCKEQQIDHLLIAYLPVYFVGMRQELGDQFVSGCTLFLKRIAQEIVCIIEQSAHHVGFAGNVTLILPCKSELARIPYAISDKSERIRYLIKQFPNLKNFSTLQTVTIINNHASAEDDKLIDYLQYEYLHEKRVTFKIANIGKEKFHAPKIKD